MAVPIRVLADLMVFLMAYISAFVNIIKRHIVSITKNLLDIEMISVFLGDFEDDDLSEEYEDSSITLTKVDENGQTETVHYEYIEDILDDIPETPHGHQENRAAATINSETNPNTCFILPTAAVGSQSALHQKNNFNENTEIANEVGTMQLQAKCKERTEGILAVQGLECISDATVNGETCMLHTTESKNGHLTDVTDGMDRYVNDIKNSNVRRVINGTSGDEGNEQAILNVNDRHNVHDENDEDKRDDPCNEGDPRPGIIYERSDHGYDTSQDKRVSIHEAPCDNGDPDHNTSKGNSGPWHDTPHRKGDGYNDSQHRNGVPDNDISCKKGETQQDTPYGNVVPEHNTVYEYGQHIAVATDNGERRILDATGGTNGLLADVTDGMDRYMYVADIRNSTVGRVINSAGGNEGDEQAVLNVNDKHNVHDENHEDERDVPCNEGDPRPGIIYERSDRGSDASHDNRASIHEAPCDNGDPDHNTSKGNTCSGPWHDTQYRKGDSYNDIQYSNGDPDNDISYKNSQTQQDTRYGNVVPEHDTVYDNGDPVKDTARGNGDTVIDIPYGDDDTGHDTLYGEDGVGCQNSYLNMAVKVPIRVLADLMMFLMAYISPFVNIIKRHTVDFTENLLDITTAIISVMLGEFEDDDLSEDDEDSSITLTKVDENGQTITVPYEYIEDILDDMSEIPQDHQETTAAAIINSETNLKPCILPTATVDSKNALNQKNNFKANGEIANEVGAMQLQAKYKEEIDGILAVQGLEHIADATVNGERCIHVHDATEGTNGRLADVTDGMDMYARDIKNSTVRQVINSAGGNEGDEQAVLNVNDKNNVHDENDEDKRDDPCNEGDPRPGIIYERGDHGYDTSQDKRDSIHEAPCDNGYPELNTSKGNIGPWHDTPYLKSGLHGDTQYRNGDPDNDISYKNGETQQDTPYGKGDHDKGIPHEQGDPKENTPYGNVPEHDTAYGNGDPLQDTAAGSGVPRHDAVFGNGDTGHDTNIETESESSVTNKVRECRGTDDNYGLVTDVINGDIVDASYGNEGGVDDIIGDRGYSMGHLTSVNKESVSVRKEYTDDDHRYLKQKKNRKNKSPSRKNNEKRLSWWQRLLCCAPSPED